MSVRFVVWCQNQLIDRIVELKSLAAFMHKLSNQLNVKFKSKQFLVIDEDHDVLRNFAMWGDLQDWVYISKKKQVFCYLFPRLSQFDAFSRLKTSEQNFIPQATEVRQSELQARNKLQNSMAIYDQQLQANKVVYSQPQQQIKNQMVKKTRPKTQLPPPIMRQQPTKHAIKTQAKVEETRTNQFKKPLAEGIRLKSVNIIKTNHNQNVRQRIVSPQKLPERLKSIKAFRPAKK